MRYVSRILLSIFALFAMMVAPAVLAGTIPAVPAGIISISGSGLGNVAVPVILTLSPANDNQPSVPPADNNITVPVKRFDNVGYIDIEFAVVPDNGVTEYYVFESIDNNTGIDWSSYIMELGFGTGANFVPSVPGDGLDFDSPTFDLPPVSTAYANVVVPNEDQLVFSGGAHSTGAEIYEIRIDVPSFLEPTGIALGSFTLRQSVVPVPEPGTLAMAALIGLALSAIGLRKRWG